MKGNIISLDDFCRFEHLHFITHDIQYLQSLQLHKFSQKQVHVTFIFITSISSLLFSSGMENVWTVENMISLAIIRSYKFFRVCPFGTFTFLKPVFRHESQVNLHF